MGSQGSRNGVIEPAIELPADSPLRGLADRPTLVVLLRSFGCTFCREAMADVAALKQSIGDAGANVAFIHGASTTEAAPWFRKYGLDVVTAVTPERPLTWTGTLLSVVVPLPSCPKEL